MADLDHPIIVDQVLTRDRSSGRIHMKLRYLGHLYVQEGCNTDDAGASDEVTWEDVEKAELHQLCRNDFPREVPAA